MAEQSYLFHKIDRVAGFNKQDVFQTPLVSEYFVLQISESCLTLLGCFLRACLIISVGCDLCHWHSTLANECYVAYSLALLRLKRSVVPMLPMNAN